MDTQNTSRQFRYLEEVRIPLHRAGFGTLPVEGEQLPVLWNGAPLCRITGKGSVFYRREDADTPQAEDALFRVEYIAAKTLEYMTAMEAAPRLKASGLDGDYRILADFGDAVLAGHPSERGVQFVTWEWDWDPQGCPPRSLLPKRLRGGQARLCPTQRASSQGSTVRARTTRRDTSGIGFRLRAGRGCYLSEGKRRSRPSWSSSSAYCRNLRNRRGQWNRVCKRCRSIDAAVFCRRNHKMKYESDRRSSPLFAPTPPREEIEPPVCRRSERCKGCPHARHGFICWHRDGRLSQNRYGGN